MIDAERDPLIRWALHARDVRVWRRPGAVVVACPDLSHWDRLVMNGDPAAVVTLLREALAATGGKFRPFGAEELVDEVAARMPELEVSARFAWMETVEPVKRHRATAELVERDRATAEPVRRDRGTVEVVERDRRSAEPVKWDRQTPVGEPGWLGVEEWPEVTGLLRLAYPESYAWPGGPDVRRWSGIRDADGVLLTVAAEAWSTPEIGFMSGVATLPEARGRGLGAAICEFTANALLDGRSRVALLVDYWNTGALATYTRLGFVTRRVAAARQVTASR